MVTMAFGTTAPDLSCTVPEMRPNMVCAEELIAAQSMIRRIIPTTVIVEQRRPVFCVLRMSVTSIEFENHGQPSSSIAMITPQEPTPCSECGSDYEQPHSL